MKYTCFHGKENDSRFCCLHFKSPSCKKFFETKKWSYGAVTLYDHKQRPNSNHLRKQQTRTFRQSAKGSGLNVLVHRKGLVCISASKGRNYGSHQFLNWWQQYVTGILRFGLFEPLPSSIILKGLSQMG